MDRSFPSPPDIPVEAVKALIEHAQQCAAYVSEEHREALAHGHVLGGPALANVQGYEFTALWLREAYEGHLSE